MGENELDIRIIEVINQLEDLIDESQRPKFGGAEKRIVDIEEIRDILGDMKVVIPEDIRRASNVLSQAEKTIASADSYAERTRGVADDNANLIMRKAESESSIMLEKARSDAEEILRDASDKAMAMIREAEAKAEAIVEEAAREREAMLEESDITKEAVRRADILRARAEYSANELFDNAKIYADSILADISGYLGRYIELVEGNRDALEVRDMQPPVSTVKQRIQTLEEPINHIISERERIEQQEQATTEAPAKDKTDEELSQTAPIRMKFAKTIDEDRRVPKNAMPRPADDIRDDLDDINDDDEDDDDDDGRPLFSFLRFKRRKKNDNDFDDDDDEE